MAPPPAYFRDEEDCLGFPIWVAELELIVGMARGSARPDSMDCLVLLHKLVATLARAPRPEIRDHQRRCEEALSNILLKGAPPSVRVFIGGVGMGVLWGQWSWMEGGPRGGGWPVNRGEVVDFCAQQFWCLYNELLLVWVIASLILF